jgi:hypothetical protein
VGAAAISAQSQAPTEVRAVVLAGFENLVFTAVLAAHVLASVLGVGRYPFVVQVRSAQQRWVKRRFLGHGEPALSEGSSGNAWQPTHRAILRARAALGTAAAHNVPGSVGSLVTLNVVLILATTSALLHC